MSSSSHAAPALESPEAKRQRSELAGDSAAQAMSSAAPTSSASTALSSLGSAAVQQAQEFDDEMKAAAEDEMDANDDGDEDESAEMHELDEEDPQPISEWSAQKRQQRADTDAQELHDAGVKLGLIKPWLRELFNGSAHPLPYLPAELSGLIADFALPPPDAAKPVLAVLITRLVWCIDEPADCSLKRFQNESDALDYVQSLMWDWRSERELSDDEDGGCSVNFIFDSRRTIPELLKRLNELEDFDGEVGHETTLHILRV